MKNTGVVKLTLKTARELAIQEFGTAKGLVKEPCAGNGYYMCFGNLQVQIFPETVQGVELIKITVAMAGGYGHAFQLHNPKTLQEDFAAEESYITAERKEALRDWVDTHGAEFCHAAVDRI